MPNRRLSISLDGDTDGLLRDAAREHGTNDGMVVKALIRHGVELLHNGDPGATTAVHDEIEADRQRRADVGRRVMDARYAARENEKGSHDDTANGRREEDLRGNDTND